MKTVAIIICTVVYTSGAIGTYTRDRELVSAGCWQWSANQTRTSSIAVAAVWPLWDFVVGALFNFGDDKWIIACAPKLAVAK